MLSNMSLKITIVSMLKNINDMIENVIREWRVREDSNGYTVSEEI